MFRRCLSLGSIRFAGGGVGQPSPAAVVNDEEITETSPISSSTSLPSRLHLQASVKEPHG